MGFTCSRNIDIYPFLTYKQFEEALITDKKKLSLVEPLTNEDRKFLQSIFIPVLDRSTVDLSSFDTEKIQGYAIVLKQIAGKILPSFCPIILYNFKTFPGIFLGERSSQGVKAARTFPTECVRWLGKNSKASFPRGWWTIQGPPKGIYFSNWMHIKG